MSVMSTSPGVPGSKSVLERRYSGTHMKLVVGSVLQVGNPGIGVGVAVCQPVMMAMNNVKTSWKRPKIKVSIVKNRVNKPEMISHAIENSA